MGVRITQHTYYSEKKMGKNLARSAKVGGKSTMKKVKANRAPQQQKIEKNPAKDTLIAHHKQKKSSTETSGK